MKKNSLISLENEKIVLMENKIFFLNLSWNWKFSLISLENEKNSFNFLWKIKIISIISLQMKMLPIIFIEKKKLKVFCLISNKKLKIFQ